MFFSSRNTLARHRPNHDFNESHACETCQRVFRRADILKRHKLTHRADALGAQLNPRRHQIDVACEACRRSKTKCDGQNPCRRCQRQHLTCQYSHRARIRLTGGDRALDGSGDLQDAVRPLAQSTLQHQFDQALLQTDIFDVAAGAISEAIDFEISQDTNYERGASTAEEGNSVPQSQVGQCVFVASLLSHYLTRMRFHSPLTMFRSVPTDKSLARNIDGYVIDAAKGWIADGVSRIAVSHACSAYSVASEAMTSIEDWPEALSRLAQTCLYDGAVLLWIYCGHLSPRLQLSTPDPESMPGLQRPVSDDEPLLVCQEHAHEILMDFANVCKKINGNAPNQTSESIWSMAFNPFAELIWLHKSPAERPVGL